MLYQMLPPFKRSITPIYWRCIFYHTGKILRVCVEYIIQRFRFFHVDADHRAL